VLALLTSQLLLGATAIHAPAVDDLLEVRGAATYAGFVLHSFALAFAVYLSHSGVASLQIGLLRALGHVVPERYEYPFLATGPRDFWRRWNRYFGLWLERYVFRPTLRACRSARHRRLRLAAPGAGLLITFLASGAVHEYVQFTASFEMSGGAMLAFALNGLLAYVGSALSRIAPREHASRWSKRGSVLLGRLGFVQLAAINAWLLVPVLAGEGLPPSLVAAARALTAAIVPR
jgi:D-alanyl-lipoteichoic acid acyltransferase DltB (MBOAT superfamily)